MTLVYRAVWEDDLSIPLNLLEGEFKDWCEQKGIHPDDVPPRGRFDHRPDLWIDVRRADVEIGRALRCTLVECDPRGRTWTTTATALSEPAGVQGNDEIEPTRTFWVDLECDDPGGGAPEMAAPRLVRGLIDNGGNPMSLGQSVRTTAIPLDAPDVGELIDQLVDPRRSVPIVVFSPDLRHPPVVTHKRADTAASTLAGLAVVYFVSPSACDALNGTLPDGFGVYGGACRLYLPRMLVGDRDDAIRHRWIHRGIIAEHPRRAASILAGRLARLQIHQPIPEAWSRLGSLLRRPSDAEVGTRAAEITAVRAAVDESKGTAPLLHEIEELTMLLAEGDLIRESAEAANTKEVARLQALIEQADEDRLDDADELDELRRELDALRRSMRLMAVGDRDGHDADGEPPHVDDLDVPTSIADAIQLAVDHLPFVVVHEDAPRDVDELDGSEKYAVWASGTWQGLRALNDYAATKTDGEVPPGLKLWCDETSAWPSSKLAMNESETVMNNPQLKTKRLLPVSRDVSADGRTFMFAHLKIQRGGGNNIPRVYFYDDTDGTTGKMHIGFIGPHRHVRNTRS